MSRIVNWLSRFNAKCPKIAFIGTFILVSAIAKLLSMIFNAINIIYWDNLVKHLDEFTILIAAFSILLAWTMYIRNWLRKKAAEIQLHFGTPIDEFERAFDAIIIQGAWHAGPEWPLNCIKPKRAEIVWTDLPELKSNVESLYEKHRNSITMEHSPEKDETAKVNDPWNFVAMQVVFRRLLRELLRKKYSRDRICVDITGSTAIMSLAAFHVAEEMKITSIFIRGTEKNEKGTPIIKKEDAANPTKAEVILISDHRIGK